MSFLSSTKKTAVALGIAVWLLFASGVAAQGADADTAYVPFLVNVNAAVKAVPAAGTASAVPQVQMSATANTQTTMRIPLPKSTGVINGAQKQVNAPAIVNNGGGKVTISLPAQSYKDAEISLYTVNGKQILRQKVSASSAANGVSRPNAAPGAYLLSVTGADGGKFTSRLTHGGGSLTLNVAFGGENITPARQLAKEAAAGEWMVTVSATGRVDSVFAFTPAVGTNPLKTITLRETAPVTPGLSAPANVTAAAASATSITVSWSAVSGATEYYVYRGASATGTYSRVGITSSATYTNTGLTSGTTYYYKVSAYNGSAESSQSPYVSATAGTPVPTVPAVPTGVTAAAASPSSITVSWNAVAGADGYYVYRSSSATGAYSKVETVTSGSVSCTNTGLTTDVTYYYKVSAYNGGGESSQSSYASAKTPLAALNPPESVTATVKTLSSITVSWPLVSGALSYRVYKSASANGSYDYALTTQTTSYLDTGLTLAVAYYYKVSVNNNAGEGPLSSYASATIEVPSIGSFIDYRDEKTYKTVTIPVLGKTWMAENLNYVAGNSWCYGNSPDSCNKYGRLYNWAAATTNCPSGWHLPSRTEWGDLVNAAYGTNGDAAKRLKSTSGWNSNGNGTDAYGFSALPGGYRFTDGSFGNAGDYGYWWTATEGGSSYAYDRCMGFDNDDVDELGNGRSNGFSVRCVRD